MKKVLLATVAATAFAPAAFAESTPFSAKQAIDGALMQINQAYVAVNGSVGAGTKSAAADLLYFADNHGAVSDVEFSQSKASDETRQSAAVMSESGDVIGYVLVDTHDYTMEMGTAKSALIGQIQLDMFGSETMVSGDLGISEVANVWSLTGKVVDADGNTVGAASKYMETQTIAALNNLEADITAAASAGWDADSVIAINTGAGEVETAADNVEDAFSKIGTATGASANAAHDNQLRTSSEGEGTIHGIPVRARIDATDSFDYGTQTGVTYSGVVNGYLTN